MNSTVMIGLVLVAYLIPTFVSSFRSHPNATAIFWLNVLLGWTALGWIVALVWSLLAIEKREEITPETHVRCPECKELVRADALKCKHCGCRLVPTEGA